MTQPAPAVPVCYRHPTRETYVRCTRCDRPICPDCMNEASVGHQCPECVAEGRRTVRPARTAFGGSRIGLRGYVTTTLVGLNVVVALIGVAMAGSGALFGGGLFGGVTRLQLIGAVTGIDWTLFSTGQYAPGALPGGEVFPGIDSGAVYRLLSGMFIHYGLLHLLLNMWAVWILGRDLEAALGPIRFAGLYLISGLGGSVAAYLFQPGSLTAGASGAIFGLFAAIFVVLRRLGRSTSSVVPVIAINLILTFSIPGISIAGHLGGLVTGAVLAAGLVYAPRRARTPVHVGVFSATVLLLAAVTALAIAA